MEDQAGVGPFSWIAAGSAQEVVGTTESGSVWVREFGDENPAGTRWNLLSSGKRLPLRNASVFFGRGWAVTADGEIFSGNGWEWMDIYWEWMGMDGQ